MAYFTFETSIGRAGIAFGEGGIIAIALPAQTEAATLRQLRAVTSRMSREAHGPVSEADAPDAVRLAARRIAAHLAGRAEDLSGIDLDMRPLTDFRRRVYEAARSIPRGEVRTYADLARVGGSPGAARAVGRAMATNPWPVVVPCHRVLSAAGALHGFSAPGGVRTKAALLRAEGFDPSPSAAGSRTPAGAARAAGQGSVAPPARGGAIVSARDGGEERQVGFSFEGDRDDAPGGTAGGRRPRPRLV